MNVSACAHPQAARVVLHVADRFIGWQETALQFMGLHLSDTSDVASFGKLTAPLLEEVRRRDMGAGMSEAELKRTVIPFAKFHWTEALEGGKQARLLHVTQNMPHECWWMQQHCSSH